MRRPKPRPAAAAPPPPPAGAFDAARLIADIRKGDMDAITRAYRVVFGSELGRLVLAHHLNECGVGRIYGSEGTDAQLRYARGLEDGALQLAEKAGFDPASHAVGVLTYQLEGTTDDAAFNHRPEPPAYLPGADEEF